MFWDNATVTALLEEVGTWGCPCASVCPAAVCTPGVVPQ